MTNQGENASVRLFLGSLLGVLLLLGCDDSKNPLSDVEKSKTDPRLSGVWRLQEANGDVTYYHIGAAGNKLPNGVMRVFGISHTKSGVALVESQVLMYSTTIGTDTYLNVTDGSDRQIKLLQEKGWGARHRLLPVQIQSGRRLAPAPADGPKSEEEGHQGRKNQGNDSARIERIARNV